MRKHALILLTALGVAAGCASSPDDDSPTIGSLGSKTVEVNSRGGGKINRDKAIKSYREFLATRPGYPLRAEAMRRLADLEMERIDERVARGVAPSRPDSRQLGRDRARARNIPGYKAAGSGYKNTIRLYESLLKAYPYYPENDRVLYQLAKAYEQDGQIDKSLMALQRLVREFPRSPFIEEAQFRRGEMLFVRRRYQEAERAYQAVVARGDRSVFYEKALFMHGWTLFKQARYDASLKSMLRLLDRKMRDPATGRPTEEAPSLSRGDRELLDDTLRAMTLSFSYLQGPRSIRQFFAKKGPRPYEHMMYERLGDLYVKQERIRDAADTYAAFSRRYPSHDRAPAFQLKVIAAYRQGRFAGQELAAMEDFVRRYAVGGPAWRNYNPQKRDWLGGELRKNLKELAQHYHARAQKTRKRSDYARAAQWYQLRIRSFPDDPGTAGVNFLLAESLYESGQYRRAVREYERTAYEYPDHTRAAEAGYAALLSYRAYEQQHKLSGRARDQWRKLAIASSLRFADSFPHDKRTAQVLTRVSEELFATHHPTQAALVAERVIRHEPPATAAQRRTAWTVIAHTEFDKGGFEKAERAYRQVLRLTPKNDKDRKALLDRLASSIYKQGEQQRATGNTRLAVAHFLRVGKVAPASGIRATAEFDAAAGLIALKDWKGATRVLQGFRSRYPDHKLRKNVTEKLAVVYLATGQEDRAAREFERIGVNSKDPEVGREAGWKAAELYRQAGKTDRAIVAYKRYVARYPRPLEPAVEARHQLAEMYKAKKDGPNYYHWLREIVKADKAGGGRTDRTRYLAAQAMFALAEPSYSAFRQVRLVRPLKKSLKIKRKKMETALKAYGRAADYGVASVTTAATYRIAEIYHDLSRDLLRSERPKGLSAEELEQYNILLEEQAFPFEEKAISAHETNAKRIRKGIYDEWVKRSYASLSRLRPVRYAKGELSEVTIDAIR